MARERVKRIGIVGTAPSSRLLAPFDDPEWEFWLMGAGYHDEGNPMRWNRWFELHSRDDYTNNSLHPGYYGWMQQDHERPIYMRSPGDPNVPVVALFPWDEILEKHGGYFLDSTVAWMMAFILEKFDVEEVGFWGVDFASDAERRKQKKGWYHFKKLMDFAGIKVTVPPESDLAYEPAPYPETSDICRKMARDIAEVRGHLGRVNGAIETMESQLPAQRLSRARFEGYIEALERMSELQ